MGSGVRDKYNVAVNGVGYILRGAPAQPAYRRDIIPDQVSRLAISDLQYSDFSGAGNFFTAQTDWSVGIKAEKMWRDDAKFYYSTNIDAYSEPGAFKLEKALETYNDYAEAQLTAAELEVNSATTNWFTGDAAAGGVTVYSGTTEKAGTTFANRFRGTCLTGHKNTLYVCTTSVVGNTTNVIKSYNGTSWTDHTAAINTAIGGGVSITSTRVARELAGVLYVAWDDSANKKAGIVSTADNGTTWVLKLTLSTARMIYDMQPFASKIYYLLVTGNISELRVFDPATNTDTSVYTIVGANPSAVGIGRLMFNFGGKLIITAPPNEIYEFDGTSLTRIFLRDVAKQAYTGEADVFLDYGGIQGRNRLYWPNLMYDGENFFNTRKDSADATAVWFVPLLIDSTDVFFGNSTTDQSIVLKDASTYKPTLAKNFLVFSEMSPVVSIDKLLYSITVVFDALAAADQIAVEYSINGGGTWTALTTMTSTTEGTNTKRQFIIPNSVIYNKVMVRIKLKGGATTPVVRDVIVAYKPIPDYKNRWILRLNMSDSVKLLDNRQDQRSGFDTLSRLWFEKNTKQIVAFEDLDYAECTLATAMTSGQTSARVDTTKRFPYKGRFRIVSAGVAEEMDYTSALPDRFLGIRRGRRGTRARAYVSGRTIKNDYDVYIDDIQSETIFTDENKTESIGQVTLLES